MVDFKTRAILAENLRRMIDAGHPPGVQGSVRAWALGKGLDVRLIDRLVKGSNAVTLDKIEEIAEACNLKPWQLLVEDMDATNPPSSPITDDERKLLRRLRHLLEDTPPIDGRHIPECERLSRYPAPQKSRAPLDIFVLTRIGH